jgi:UDP-glucose 4-epimerase
MIPDVDRVYDNTRARASLGWAPRHDFLRVLERAAGTGDWRSPLARRIGHKGYHDQAFDEGPFPVE